MTSFSIKHPWIIIVQVLVLTAGFIIQFPKVKFDNDPEDMFIHIDHPGSAEYPALSHVAFGFVPETVSDDNAHLDAFIVSTGAAGPGEMMRVRALGYLHRSDGDHKLFCVPEKHSAKAMVDVPKPILEACEAWKIPAGGTAGTWMDGSQARELIRRCTD